MLPSKINSLIQDVINICIAEAQQRGVSVSMRLADDLPLILADPVQIQQVVLNLVRNAIEAMEELPAEFGRLVVMTRLASPGMVEVMVEDNGCGVPGVAEGRVFTPFFTTKPQGMGMGLSISRTIVEAHRGHLSLESNPHHSGSTARFALPVFDEALI
jgi:signal transduction histidine kinase